MQIGKRELREPISTTLQAQITNILITFFFSIGNGVPTGLLPFVHTVVSEVIKAGTRVILQHTVFMFRLEVTDIQHNPGAG